MAEVVTLKEMEEKYGWGFVVFKNVPRDNSDYLFEGEYAFHSQDKRQCWDLIDDTNSQGMRIFPFGVNPKYAGAYAFLSPFTLVREEPVEYKKAE